MGISFDGPNRAVVLLAASTTRRGMDTNKLVVGQDVYVKNLVVGQDVLLFGSGFLDGKEVSVSPTIDVQTADG
jgi:hypothetical protein